MGNHEIALSFRRALVAADSLVAMARCDSAERGWQSTESACIALADLLPSVDRLLFDRDIRDHLSQCPPAGCTPDGAGLADVGQFAVSWHHLACDLAQYVAMKAMDEVIGLDTVFLFAELENDHIEYVPVDSGDDVKRFEGRRLKPGEKRAGRLAEALRQIRANGRDCWPAMAGALRTTGLNSDHFKRVWAGVGRECRELERASAPAQAADERPKPIHLDYVCEVAKNYLGTIRRVENAKAIGRSQEAIIGLENHRDALGRELVEYGQKPIGCFTGDIEQVDDWQRMEKPDDALKLAAAIVRQIAGEEIGAPLPPPAQDAIAEQWPPNDGWHFRAGLYAFRGKQYALGGKLWKLLKHLADARFPSTAAAMMDAMGSDAKEESSIRTDLANLRSVLRQNHNLPKDSDPIPCQAKGDPSAWELRIDCRAPAMASKPKPKPKGKNKRRISVRKNDR